MDYLLAFLGCEKTRTQNDISEDGGHDHECYKHNRSFEAGKCIFTWSDPIHDTSPRIDPTF